jgi:uncharacterized membrane protein
VLNVIVKILARFLKFSAEFIFLILKKFFQVLRSLFMHIIGYVKLEHSQPED